MKVHLEHFGKVASAIVELSGITVVAGPNKSGKSTIGRVLMTYGTLLRRMDELVQNRKLRQFLERLGERLGLSELYRYRLNRVSLNDYQADDLLSPDFWSDKDRFSSLVMKVLRTIPPSRAKGVAEEMANLDPNEIVEILNEFLRQDDSLIMHDIMEERFRDVFVGQINSLNNPETEACISFLENDLNVGDLSIFFKHNSLTRNTGKMSMSFPKIIYLEPMHIMDVIVYSSPTSQWFASNRYGAGDCSWDNIMEPSRVVREDISLADKQEVSSLLDEIKLILGGELDVNDGRIQFKEKSAPEQTLLVELENLASGMKSMTVILQALANYSLRRGMIFVIDEPESNLHPEWQVKFALVLVHLWKKLGIRIIVATHSPYFLKGLEMCAASVNVLDNMSCYLMKYDKNEKGMVAHDVTKHLNDVYKTFFDPLNNIMANNGELQ